MLERLEMSMSPNYRGSYSLVNRNSDLNIGDNYAMNIGERVRQARLEKRMTQGDLAAKVGIRQPTLSELEKGDSNSTSHIAKLAAALGVSALWLETGRGQKFPTGAAANSDKDELANVALLVRQYYEATDSGRELILSTAGNVTKRDTSANVAVVGDKS
jgi:transcriptional regulator with XRE-family HTH domain